MTTRLTVKYSSDLLVATTIILAMFFTASAFAANIPMEIIQPQPNLTTTNRYYKAYPGIEYNVKVGVLGGTFPFVYSLTTKPTGMTINTDTGVISWPSPPASGTPYKVTVSVTDAENTTVTRSWTITVTTSGFYFLDSVNGNDSNSGSISSPWKTIAAWDKGIKYDTTYQNAFLYYRAGTYYTRTTGVHWESYRFPLYQGGKPNVWLGYPGETAVINVRGAYIEAYSNSYFDQLDIVDNADFGIRIGSEGTGLVIRRIRFSKIYAEDTSNNQSGLMITHGDSMGSNKLISENTCNDMTYAYCILGYYSDKVLVEYNTMFNMIGKHGIGPKAYTTNWSIRKNTAVRGMNTLNVLWLGLGNGDNESQISSNIDISFNNISASSGTALSIGAEGLVYGPVYSYKNTYIGRVEVLNTVGSTPVSFIQDTMSNPPPSLKLKPNPPTKLLLN